ERAAGRVSLVMIVLAVPAVLGSWAALEVSSTDRYVATVEPLIHDPAIPNVLADRITNEITSRLNITGIVNQASAEAASKGLPCSASSARRSPARPPASSTARCTRPSPAAPW